MSLEGVVRLSGLCWKTANVVVRLSAACGEIVRKVWGDCLEYVGKLCRQSMSVSSLFGVGRMSGVCREAVWRVWGD